MKKNNPLRTWLHAQSALGTSIMEEPTTHAQLVGAALIIIGILLFCIGCAHFLVYVPATATLCKGSRMIQGKNQQSEFK